MSSRRVSRRIDRSRSGIIAESLVDALPLLAAELGKQWAPLLNVDRCPRERKKLSLNILTSTIEAFSEALERSPDLSIPSSIILESHQRNPSRGCIIQASLNSIQETKGAGQIRNSSSSTTTSQGRGRSSRRKTVAK
ncbi:hypothetical protein HN011_003841 [Eciton burchellii]|nr:hypothetical protein HN011_003841 [Eciton burchellii]